MRGPCACPRRGTSSGQASYHPNGIVLRRGQAQGPHLSPHPPLVPTGRGGCLIHHSPFDCQKSSGRSNFIETRSIAFPQTLDARIRHIFQVRKPVFPRLPQRRHRNLPGAAGYDRITDRGLRHRDHAPARRAGWSALRGGTKAAGGSVAARPRY